jgi:hypothetical protein
MRIPIALSAVVGVLATALPSAAFAQARQEQTPQNRFCLEIGQGLARCAYQTLAQCERARVRGSTGRCFDTTYVIAATPPGDTAASPERSAHARIVAKRRRSSR